MSLWRQWEIIISRQYRYKAGNEFDAASNVLTDQRWLPLPKLMHILILQITWNINCGHEYLLDFLEYKIETQILSCWLFPPEILTVSGWVVTVNYLCFTLSSMADTDRNPQSCKKISLNFQVQESWQVENVSKM